MPALIPNPLYAGFADVLRRARAPFSAWEGHAFRNVTLEFARSSRLLDGQGSMRHGARWTPPKAFPAVSLSLDPATAEREALRRAEYYGWDADVLRPRVRVAIHARLGRALDLRTPPRSLVALASTREWLEEDWRKVNDGGKESVSQALARAARDTGAEGLIAPSSAGPDGENLVVFPDRLGPGSLLEIVNRAELERWIKKR